MKTSVSIFIIVKEALTFRGTLEAPLTIRTALSHLHRQRLAYPPVPTNLHLSMLLALALTRLSPQPAGTGGQLSPDSFSLLLGLSLSFGLSSCLSSSSFICLHLLCYPLFALSNNQHTNPVVGSQSLPIVLLIVIVVLDRTRQDGELCNSF